MGVIMQLRDVSFSRGSRSIIQSVNLTLHSGQFIGLIGPNGTGKSTLLRMMARLLKPDEGYIELNAARLKDLTDLEVARAITYMPQSTELEYQFTVEQIVQMGRHPHRKKWQGIRREDLRIADKAMELTGIECLKKRFITTLSGGERQLVFLARSIAQQSQMVLLDEPTSDLDIYHQVKICEVIEKLVQEGKTVIAAIHDINLAARYCDRILLLHKGTIMGFDEPGKIITPENILRVFQTNAYTFKDPYLEKRQVIPYAIYDNQ